MDAVWTMNVVPAIYDSASTLVPLMPAVKLYILKVLLFSCVLGVPFLSAHNPVIDWAGQTVAFSF